MLFREYKTLKALNAGETVELEGYRWKKKDGEIQKGDFYIAERNTGPQLLTAAVIVPWPTVENGLEHGGWIQPMELAYSYDLGECVRVEEA